MGRQGEQSDPVEDHRFLVEKYRSLCQKYRLLVERYGADVDAGRSTLTLAFSAIRRSHTGIALVRNGMFLVRNVRWLSLERCGGDDWRCGGRAYPSLRALAIGEASAMARAGEWSRELRFSRAGAREVIEVRIEKLDRPGMPVYLAMARDVTEAALAAEREERARSEAAERERLHSVGELASATAHEINNVLHAMALRIASLRGEVEGTQREASLEALAHMVTEAAGCTARLQDVAGRSRPAAPAEPSPEPRTKSEPPRLRVLVVDDDRDVLEAAGLALQHLKQQVDLAPSGVEAVARFMAGERFDLVLCDIGMPGLDGWQVAREVQALAPETKIYLISGWAREIEPGDVQHVGAAGLLAKPLSMEALRGLLVAPGGGPQGGGVPAHDPGQGAGTIQAM